MSTPMVTRVVALAEEVKGRNPFNKLKITRLTKREWWEKG